MSNKFMHTMITDPMPGSKKGCMSGLLTIIVTIVLFPYGMQAQNITRPNFSGPSGLQVNSYTGSLFYQRKDLYIPGTGLSLNINFAYNSSERINDRGYGYGWTFEYNQFYVKDSSSVTIYNGDGRADQYVFRNNKYESPKGTFTVLTEYESGKFKITTTDKTEYFFANSTHKKLTRIKDRNDNEMLLTYVGDLLDNITDVAGRKTFFVWQDKRLKEIRAEAGTPARIWKYAYNLAGCLTSVTDPLNNSIQYNYSAGRVISNLTDGNGNSTVISYNSNKAVIKLVSCQRDMSFTYNAEQKKTYLIEKNGNNTVVTTYEFDHFGRLIGTVGNCCGFKNSFAYDEDNNITEVIDAKQKSYIFTYDKHGNLLSKIDATGNDIRYVYDTILNSVKSIKDKNGNFFYFEYNTKGNLSEIKYPSNSTEKFSYNSKGEKISVLGKENDLTKFEYNSQGDVIKIYDALNGLTEMSYDNWGNCTSTTDAKGKITTFVYNNLGFMVKKTDALGGEIHKSYDANGNLISVTDAQSNLTKYIYDAQNNLISKIDPLGNVKIISHDAFGNITSRTDPNGLKIYYEFDDLSRLVKKTNASGENTLYEYDAVGNILTVQFPNGNKVNLTYDNLNRIIKVADKIGTISNYSYDANSNKISESDGAGNSISYKYDEMNRLIQQTDPVGNSYTYEYDKADNIIKKTDRLKNTTLYTYDALRRKSSQTYASGATVNYIYDKVGNLLTISDAKGNTTSYSYDDLNRNTQEKFADNTIKRYSFDANGNIISRQDNKGITTNYYYDKVNRPVARVYPQYTDSFKYDISGRLIIAKNKNSTVSFTHDRTGRITSETLNGKTTSYLYNILSGNKLITYPDGRQIQRKMDLRGRLMQIESLNKLLTKYEYNAADQIASRKYGNDLISTYAYNANSNLVDANLNINGALGFHYNYDIEDNPVSTYFNHQPDLSEKYKYDKLNQVISFEKNNKVIEYEFDLNGNRKTSKDNSNTTSYSINNMNAYVNITGSRSQTNIFDENGNIINNGESSYLYDPENRIVEANNGQTIRYVYDALGRRIKKSYGSDEINYSFDGLQIIEERNGYDSVLASYVWGTWLDDAVCMYKQDNYFYYHANSLGSIMAISDSNGLVLERYEYDAFGNTSIFSGNYISRIQSSLGNKQMYTGREFDAETGLYYYRARHYDPRSGSFLQRDPLGLMDKNEGLYGYVFNKPLKYIDPFGTSAVPNTCILIGGKLGDANDIADIIDDLKNGTNLGQIATTTAAGAIGGWAGAKAGAWAGGWAGYYAGTIITLGNPVGGIIGGLIGVTVGGIIGGTVGGFAGGEIAEGFFTESDGSDQPPKPIDPKQQQIFNQLPPYRNTPDLKPIDTRPQLRPAPRWQLP